MNPDDPVDPGETADHEELVEVFRCADPTLLAIVRSALDAASVRHVVLGGAGPGLFPLGPFAMGLRHNLVEARILVEPADVERAGEVLAGAEPIGDE